MVDLHKLDLPDLDKQATRKEIEDVFEQYRLYKHFDYEERQVGTTSFLKDIVVSQSGTSDQTASIAIHNVDTSVDRERFCEKVERAVQRLPEMERFLIEKRYMSSDAEYLTDTKVYNYVFDPPIGVKFYYKLRWKAFYKLALALDLDVVSESGNN
ncbi:ArpU family phage packaging/lysis transcriptional regulator [Shouchella lonarensis]|uniref:Phage transcriptional regulator, ArpU family n=1 Tax=Shouchella lonarensis TaxID=1464122 RepID=A0A1G6ING1_9BACI|nr:ArpU family phage packaging/lysis transcriptional regulator [Shouchella lonarensis]SDC07545.1 phage transcriptional regulator, ArpU family [Shouchella lonarensis]